MAAKRRPGSELNHDNWDDEEECEEGGEFKKATAEELKKRVLKVAKRRTKVDGDDSTDAGGVAKKTSSIFGSFSGFGKPVAETKSGASPFAFLSSTTSVDKSTNGSAVASASVKATISSEKSSTYYAKLKGLNQSVAAWITKHVETNPLCILTPIFDDYAKHLKEIEALETSKKAVDTTVVPAAPVVASTTSMSSFAFAKAIDKADPAASTGFSFGPPKTTEAAPKSTSSSSIFGINSFSAAPAVVSTASTATASSFSFGGPSAATAITGSSTGFSFGSSTSSFSFSNVTKPTEEKSEADKEADDEDQPPKVEFTPVVEKDCLYSKRCKVFVKGTDGYNDRGVGTLYIKSAESGDKTQLIVRADTNLGNILLNILLSKAVPTVRTGKNNVTMVCIPTPDSKPPPSTVLLRVKNAEEADELLEEINKYKK